jgi:exopolysaccharide biosynthesis predicted pyruvyltransferase EpsI
MSLPLLPIKEFKPLIDVIGGKRIFFDTSKGNSGDSLIRAGTKCLFSKINTTLEDNPSHADFIVWGGGGNLGKFYQVDWQKRQKLYEISRQFKKRMIILPQSVIDLEEVYPLETIFFLRERRSIELIRHAIFCPDLSFAFDESLTYASPTEDTGIYLRTDREKIADSILSQKSLGDPALLSKDYKDYFRLIERFSRIITNRLHFAIAGLMMGRKVSIMPNSYHKNRGMWEASLNEMGCDWMSPPTLL